MSNISLFKKREVSLDPVKVWTRSVIATLLVIVLLLGCGATLYYLSLYTNFFGTVTTDDGPARGINTQMLDEVAETLRERRSKFEVFTGNEEISESELEADSTDLLI